MKAVLISTYELGHQPFGLASPAAWIRDAGIDVRCIDASRERLDEGAVRNAALVAFYVPMHTATRLAAELLSDVRRINPGAHICFYGLYAPVNEAWLRRLGADTILGGEFEEGLAHLARRLVEGKKSRPQEEQVISLARQKFKIPSRAGLVPLEKYAHVALPSGEKITAGYTEASRGCKHMCRHCPIVPVYNGVFRIIDRSVVLADIRQQVSAGARHITFGDPDFFNGIGHAIPIVKTLHEEFPGLSYDVTIKIEHLLKHVEHLPTLHETGCLFVTSAVESVDDAILEKLDKRHTRSDFLNVVARFRAEGMVLQPTFMPFTPWTTLEGYLDLLEVLAENRLIESVAPIQLAIRLLIPRGSRLLELDEVRGSLGAFNERGMVYPWNHADRRIDDLCGEVRRVVHSSEELGRTRAQTFVLIEGAARQAAGFCGTASRQPLLSRAAVPYLTEPWYC